MYVDFVKDVSPLCIALDMEGCPNSAYHGSNMSTSDKQQVLQSWRSGSIRVVVATKAFGMGIDQPDVRVVVCVGCPQTMEDMVQEFGRAGRDGHAAEGT